MAKNNGAGLLIGSVLLLGAAAAAAVAFGSSGAPLLAGKLNAELWKRIEAVAKSVGADPEHLALVMQFESRFNPAAVNPYSGASGLIQFMPSTSRALGTTVEAIRRMSALDQMALVERYFEQTQRAFAPGRALDTLQAVAMAVFYPKYMFVSPSTLFPPEVIAANTTSKFTIRTPADYLALVQSAPPFDEVQPLPPTEQVELEQEDAQDFGESGNYESEPAVPTPEGGSSALDRAVRTSRIVLTPGTYAAEQAARYLWE